MQTIHLPTWLIKHLEGMRRSFFWKGRDKCLGGHCLVNWATCCLPKKNGGLGIVNLSTQNEALLTKWLWKLHSDISSTWTTTVLSFYGTTDLETLSTIPNVSHGFRDILQLRQFYQASTNQVLHSWKWSPSGSFTVSSAYRVLVDPGVISPFHKKALASQGSSQGSDLPLVATAGPFTYPKQPYAPRLAFNPKRSEVGLQSKAVNAAPSQSLRQRLISSSTVILHV